MPSSGVERYSCKIHGQHDVTIAADGRRVLDQEAQNCQDMRFIKDLKPSAVKSCSPKN